MGKVKLESYFNSVISATRINSQWERLRSCPNLRFGLQLPCSSSLAVLVQAHLFGMPSHRFAAPPLPKMRGISGTPYLQEDEPKAKSDWLSATAKGDRYQCTFRYRTSIPYGKGKDGKSEQQKDRNHVSIPYGKGKVVQSLSEKIYSEVSIPNGKGKGNT